VSERKNTRHVILWPTLCNTRGNIYGLHRARREGTVAAIPPLVGHHRAIAVHHGGTPGDGGGGVGAFVVLNTKIGEWEDTLSALLGIAGIWYTNRRF